MLYLTGADAEGQCAECAMGCGMGIAADNGHAGLGKALLRADNMHDALAFIIHFEIRDTEFGAIILQRLDLDARCFIFYSPQAVRRSRYIVIRYGQCRIRTPGFPLCHTQTFKGLWAGHFMNKVAVNIQQAGAVACFMNQMRFKDFIVESFGGHG